MVKISTKMAQVHLFFMLLISVVTWQPALSAAQVYEPAAVLNA
jgi:hypothetical protein